MEGNILQQIDNFLNQLIFGVSLYRWAFALLVFFLFLFLRKVFALIILKSVKTLVSKTKTDFDDKLIDVIESPLNFLFIVIGVWFALDILEIEADITVHFVKSLFIFDVFWIFFNAVNIFTPDIYKFTEKFGKDLSKEIGSLIIKLSKSFIVVLGFVAVLQEWGINVTALIASLGLGGLAFALAAKDTVANFFGGITILADKSMKIGEWIKVGNIEGIVEDIGIRTTKIRTFEKGLITVPNSYIANNPLENFSRRNVRRVKMKIGVVYSTSKENLQKIVEEIRNLINTHPKVAKDQTIAIYFDEFGDSSLNIFIYFYTNTANWLEWFEIKEEIQYKIIDIVERNGSSFAFPSRSIYIEEIPQEVKN
jgi:MscS family membrane protein